MEALFGSFGLVVLILLPMVAYAGYDLGRYVERRRQAREVDTVLERMFSTFDSKGGESP